MKNSDSLVEYGARRVIIVVMAILCALLEIVDTTIVNVALDSMKGSLGVTLEDVAWVVTAYAIANVIMVPMTAWLSQQFGRRNYFVASIMVFTVTSFLCGNATSMEELIVFRFIQGLGGGALLVTSQTIITEIFPLEKRGMAQAIYGMGVIVGPTLGPPLGGYIVDNFSWPYIFYINLPVGIVATLLAINFVKSPRYSEKRKVSEVDWWGIILLSTCVGSLQYVLEHGQQDDWFHNQVILFLSIITVLSAIFFFWRELIAKYPIVNIRILKNTNLAVGTVLTFVLGFGLYGSTFIIPIYTQSILGWTATDAGMLLVPSSVMTGLMMPIIGKLLQRGVPQKYLVSMGFAIFFIYSLSVYYMMTPYTSSANFFWPLIIRGVGLGLLFVPITTLSLSTLRGSEIAEGAAFTGMMRQLGGSFGIALITTFIYRDSQKHRINLMSHMDITRDVVAQRLQVYQQMMIAKGATAQEALARAYKMLEGQLIKQVMVLTYADAFLYLGVLFVVCIPFVLSIKQGKAAINPADAMH
ncbi:DHA2 family efflux MFS transporter permease subunit [Elizabethkingia argentiflava]|uniref:DHA2 family efflux MFS transporter permease subunit n=1 Tax=Elizabethkingia argenteiflava TaxID=2681556 RepID=A0A845PWG9_9FLAO|nr:DHA2 family efflux MFS transporter permease subunit [Elizabethkingia argenteiflava]NAW52194.1 DHA2 family efflux MFS transporter permease subunit [Elizabethkingia argenteiflava]